MVQFGAEHPGAEGLPVIARVGEVEVPGLIDRIGWRHLVPGGHGEIAEPLVFADHALGMGGVPAVLAGKAGGEGKGSLCRTGLVTGDALP